jgi:hypothetical protein
MRYILALTVGLGFAWFVIHTHPVRHRVPLTITLYVDGDSEAEYLQNVKEALNKVEALGYDAEELER